tara:strand:+ start:2697 stop:2858 length:162 start_codon:yes stop_codon:yes gene_type:complete
MAAGPVHSRRDRGELLLPMSTAARAHRVADRRMRLPGSHLALANIPHLIPQLR